MRQPHGGQAAAARDHLHPPWDAKLLVQLLHLRGRRRLASHDARGRGAATRSRSGWLLAQQ